MQELCANVKKDTLKLASLQCDVRLMYKTELCSPQTFRIKSGCFTQTISLSARTPKFGRLVITAKMASAPARCPITLACAPQMRISLSMVSLNDIKLVIKDERVKQVSSSMGHHINSALQTSTHVVLYVFIDGIYKEIGNSTVENQTFNITCLGVCKNINVILSVEAGSAKLYASAEDSMRCDGAEMCLNMSTSIWHK